MVHTKTINELLMMAKGHRSLNTFAREAGVSNGNLSRIFNGQRATPDVLEKLSKVAHNDVSYEQLMIASGYVDPSKFDQNQEGVVFSEFFNPIRMVKIPLIGSIPAGHAVEAIENVESWINVPEDQVKDGDYFYLRVKGDSMTGSRIWDGDLVLVKRQSFVTNGEIAVVRINAEDATLKRVKHVDGTYILYPDNPAYEPTIVKDYNAEIIGIVVKVEFRP